MTLKSMYLDIRQLKGLKKDLNFIASKKLLNTLDEYIENNNQGNYLINIFDEYEMRELNNLKENYFIKVFIGYQINKESKEAYKEKFKL